jgi:hypothetical protein
MAPKTKTYTVVGMYRDNHQVYVTFVEAGGVAEAVAMAKGELPQECSRCGGVKEEPGAPERPGEMALCIACKGTGVESMIAVLSVFEGEHRDIYEGDELYEE